MKTINKKIILSFILGIIVSFAYSQRTKTECQFIQRQTIAEAKSISDVFPELNGCSIIQYEIISRVKGKPMTAAGDNDEGLMGELKTFVLHCDKDAKMYIDITATCNGKKTSKNYCFKVKD